MEKWLHGQSTCSSREPRFYPSTLGPKIIWNWSTWGRKSFSSFSRPLKTHGTLRAQTDTYIWACKNKTMLFSEKMATRHHVKQNKSDIDNYQVSSRRFWILHIKWYMCVYINAYALKVKAKLSKGMNNNKTRRKRETGRVRGNMVKAHVTITHTHTKKKKPSNPSLCTINISTKYL